MKFSPRSTLVALAFFGLGSWGIYSSLKMEPKAARWEYRIVESATERDLNTLGAARWELVTVIGSTFYLKRLGE